MLVGAPLTGKTTVYRVLAEAMNLVAYREAEGNVSEPIHTQVPGEGATEQREDGGLKAPKEVKQGIWQGVDIQVVHPKSLTLGQLFGKVTNTEWHEGLLSSMIRQMSADTSGIEYTLFVDNKMLTSYPGRQQWIILDGPVDPLWIESMNTVLDDNRILCLTNGERLPVPKNVIMVCAH